MKVGFFKNIHSVPIRLLSSICKINKRIQTTMILKENRLQLSTASDRAFNRKHFSRAAGARIKRKSFVFLFFYWNTVLSNSFRYRYSLLHTYFII